MANIELVIKVPEDTYKDIIKNGFIYDEDNEVVTYAIKNGTPLPKGHGDLIDRNLALSDDGLCEFHRYDDYVKMRNYLKSISTIIEADKESEGV